MNDQRDLWDAEAATFDDEPDHGLRDPATRAAWASLLLPLVPAAPSDVVDLGCGTGSLSLLLAEAGHRVRGLDLSPNMLAAARAKAGHLGATFVEGDAADPPYADGSADAVVVRHVLWALPDPAAALARWARLLRPGGRLLLVEGRWHTGGGLPSSETVRLTETAFTDVHLRPLPDPVYWGRPIDDERYLVTATCPE